MADSEVPVVRRRAIVGAGALMLGAVTNVAFLVEGYTAATLDPANTFVSELGSKGQPSAEFFRGSDFFTGVLLLIGLTLAMQLLPRNLLLRIGLAFALAFSAMTAADAFLPLDCVPSVDRSCRAAEEAGQVSLTHEIHSITGVLESFCGFLALLLIALGLRQLERRGLILQEWRALAHFLVLTGLVYAALSVVIAVQYLLETNGIGIVQRLQVVIFAAAMFALGLVLRHHRTYSRPVTTSPSADHSSRAVSSNATSSANPVRIETRSGQEPTVVFCNGLGETLDFWHTVVSRLDGVANVTYDRPGRDPGEPSRRLSGEVAEIDAILAEADVEGRLIMVGHSFGGVLAEAYSRYHPDRVAGLVLVDASTPEEYADDEAETGDVKPVGAARGAINATLVSRPMRPLLKFTLPKAMVGMGTTTGSTREILSQLPADFADHLSHPSHLARTLHDNAHIGGYCRDLITLRQEAPLPQMGVRVLVGRIGPRVWRREQTSWIEGQREQLKYFGGDVEMTLLESAHMVMLDQPDAVAESIRSLHDGAKATGGEQ